MVPQDCPLPSNIRVTSNLSPLLLTHRLEMKGSLGSISLLEWLQNLGNQLTQ